MGPFGQRLRREREQRGITLDEVSLSTKISPRFLRALEEEHFEQLPGGIFNKSFVRAYARHLGIDEEDVVTGYLKAAGELPVQNKPEKFPIDPRDIPAPKPAASSSSTFSWQSGVAALASVVLVFAIWQVYSRLASRRHISETGAVAAPSPSGAPVEIHPTAAVSAASPAPSPASTSSSSGVSLASESRSEVPAIGTPFTLLIKAEDDCWLSITVDGKPLMSNMLLAFSEKSIHAQHEIVVKAGNIGAVEFWFAGKKLHSQGDYGEVKTLTFTSAGLQSATPAPKISTTGELHQP